MAETATRRRARQQQLGEEIWRQCPYYGAYEVSNLGRIRRALPPVNNHHRHRSGAILQTSVDRNSKDRIVTLMLDKDDPRRTNRPWGFTRVSLGRLICIAFHGMPKGTRGRVIYLDGNKGNLRADNLTWGAPYAAKLNADLVAKMRAEFSAGAKMAAIARKFGFNTSTVWRAIRGYSWKEVAQLPQSG